MSRTRRSTADASSAGKRALITVGKVLIVLTLLCGVCVGFGLLRTKHVPVTPQHKTALHTATDVAKYLEFQVDPTRGTWSAARAFDGATTLAYEYDDLDGEVVFIHSALHYTRKEVDAALLAEALWDHWTLSLEGDGMELEEAAGLLDVGESRVGFVVSNGIRNSVVIVVRKSKHVYVLLIGGKYLDDPVLLREFLGPKLEDMEDVRVGK